MAVRPLKITVLADARQASRELSSFGSRLRGALGGAAALVGFAGIAAGVKSVVTAASDAEQSIGATETVFGKFADNVIAKSDKAAKSYGLSANDYRTSANLIGSLFKNQGVAVDKLAGKTDDMIGVASDLAATFGGTTADAVDALGSSLQGRVRPDGEVRHLPQAVDDQRRGDEGRPRQDDHGVQRPDAGAADRREAAGDHEPGHEAGRQLDGPVRPRDRHLRPQAAGARGPARQREGADRLRPCSR